MNCEKWQNARVENTNELIKWLFSFDSSTKQKVFANSHEFIYSIY